MQNAVELINSNLDIRKILNHYEFENITGNGMLRASCKIHNGKNTSSFVINEETGLWYCHSGCGGGDVFTLAQRIDKIGFIKSVNRIAGILGINIADMEIIEYKPQYLKDAAKWLNLMKRKKPKFMVYTIPVETSKVNKFRNFKKETLEKFKLQYVKKITVRTYSLHNRLLIPINFNEKLVGIVLRKTKIADFPKWSNLPEGIETGNLLYNYDTAKEYNTINIVEGIFDVWAMDEAGYSNTIATFGAHMSPEQEKLLLKTSADLVICYDGDNAGITATNKCIEKMKYKANLRIINLPEGKDPCDLEQKELQKLMNNTLKINEWRKNNNV